MTNLRVTGKAALQQPKYQSLQSRFFRDASYRSMHPCADGTEHGLPSALSNFRAHCLGNLGTDRRDVSKSIECDPQAVAC